uniref:Formylglycine-generating enzyme, required for sulfatase activity, contains SUMF1/FGE domain n=1 Tax=Candidatus Kentrum sp. FW TaxID=2126338 RepID=A0A450U224_9GAMM|nr:MAG: Formylglycine-generating enzyme, required for sulfatase activity, contains SUMF1/FGE domain [Candidatus Kentron sp. FW]
MEKIALLIGVSEYPSQALTPLPAAVRDIAALGEVLCHPDMGGFSRSHVTLLPNPGRFQMEEAIETLFSGRHRDDLVLLFFSGHGIKDDTGRLYLASRDTRETTQGELVRASAIAAGTVHDYMEDSRSRRQIVILDSCSSGAFPEGLSLKDDGRIDIQAQLGGEGRAILASSSSTQYSFEQKDKELSLYTRFLVRGIQTGEADRDGDGIITIGELHDYARQKVQDIQPAMRPEIYPGKEGYAIRIAQAPVGDPREKYAGEVAQAMDHRGGITSVAARATLQRWRDRLDLDPATCKSIEEEVATKRRDEFHNKCREYAQVVREVLEGKTGLETEAEHLAKLRRMLGLTEAEAREVEAGIEKEISTQRHQRKLERYAALFREAIRQEGSSLSDETRVQMAGIRQALGLTDEEAETIRLPAKLDIRFDIPEARVSIDGEDLGGFTYTLAAGDHTVQVSKTGYEPFETRIRLEPGEERTLPVTLAPKPARLIVRSNVSGDIVIIDGKAMGPTNPDAYTLTPGAHTIRVEKKGFEPFETRVVLAAGGGETIRARLVAQAPIANSPVAGQTFRDRLKDGSPGPRMVVLPAGEFMMGSPEDEPGRDSDEGPQHRVRIANPFALGVTQVTFADYDRFAQATGRKLPDDKGWGRDRHPVIRVSWKDARAYAQWLSEETDKEYRLPTEAEWEYAARAGTTTPFSTGDCITTDQANYKGNVDYANCGAKTGVYREKTVPVGSLPANPWGLHEMHGNVWEWTADCWHGDYNDAPEDGSAWGEENGGDCSLRALRGGAWNFEPRRLRSAFRGGRNPGGALDNMGFRLARAL